MRNNKIKITTSIAEEIIKKASERYWKAELDRKKRGLRRPEEPGLSSRARFSIIDF